MGAMSEGPTKPRRWPRFQFAIRDVIWFTAWLAVAMAIVLIYLRQRRFNHDWGIDEDLTQLAWLCIFLGIFPASGFVGTCFGRPILGALVGIAALILLAPFVLPVIQAAR
jgi:hypothetical protein